MSLLQDRAHAIVDFRHMTELYADELITICLEQSTCRDTSRLSQLQARVLQLKADEQRRRMQVCMQPL